MAGASAGTPGLDGIAGLATSLAGTHGSGAAAIELTAGSNAIYNEATGVIRGGNSGGGIALAGDGIKISAGATAEIVNLGLISSGLGLGAYGINNAGTVTSLTNAQGGTGASPLTYTGILPVAYTMVLNSQASYGQLAAAALNVGGLTTLSVTSDLGSGLATQKFSNVITGVEADLITNKGANYAFRIANGVLGLLGNASSANTDWDLRVLNFGNDLAEPQRNTLEQRNYAMRFGLGYNCDSFGTNNYCVSFQSSNVRGNNQSGETTGVLIGAKRFNQNLQVGLFRASGASSDGGVEIGSRQPLTGVFLNFATAADGTGLQGRLSYASELSKATLTRSNILGTATSVTGKADLDASGTDFKIGWGIGLPANHVLTPFLAFTSSKAARLAYSESNAAGVDAPFSYAEYTLSRSATTAGLDLKGKVSEELSYRLSLGAEQSSYKLNDFELAGAFGKASYTPSSLTSNGLGYNASVGFSYKFSDKVSVHVNATVRKLDTSTDAVNFVSTGLHIGF